MRGRVQAVLLTLSPERQVPVVHGPVVIVLCRECLGQRTNGPGAHVSRGTHINIRLSTVHPCPRTRSSATSRCAGEKHLERSCSISAYTSSTLRAIFVATLTSP